MRRLLFFIWIAVLHLSPMQNARCAEATAPITLFAAASLQGPLDQVALQWRQQSQQTVRISYAATSVLALQIERGAQVDIFISADVQWMDYLQRANMIDADSRHDFLGNRLVLVAPAQSPGNAFDLRSVSAWLEALQNGRLSLAETVGVPAGRHAREALSALGVWDALQPVLAQSDNVRSALAFVALGETSLGIVYATDAQAEPRVRVLQEIPLSLHAPIVYPVARLAAAEAARSKAFMRYLQSDPVRQIFARAGFKVLISGH